MKNTYLFLENKNLAKTPCRIEILKVLEQKGVALSEHEIKQHLSYDYDRATIFRTLKTFLQKGIIHSITVEGKDVRYAISAPAHSERKLHAHFHCTVCRDVQCLKNISMDEPVLPEGFYAKDFDLVINGFCRNCGSGTNKNKH
jgi:Fur family transcriptional regulator, ferric uptake regulator